MPKSAAGRPHLLSRMETDHQKQVLDLARSLSATLGTDFFLSVVRHLATTFHADFVYLGEVPGSPADRVRTLAVFRKERIVKNFEQKLAGTASAQVLADGSFACSKDVATLFPLDTLLETLTAQGYAGIRLCDSNGQQIGILGVVTRGRLNDVRLVKSVLEAFAPRAAAELERKRSDDIHRENEERYHAFVASNPDAMWRIEFDQPIPVGLPEDEQINRIYRYGYLAECNDAFAKMAGVASADSLVGSRFSEIAPRTDARVVAELGAAIRSGFRATTVETVPHDGSGRPSYRLRSQFGIVAEGELRRLWMTTRDITQLREAELSLAASERRFREILEGIQLPAIMLDLNGGVTFANECFLRLAQRSSEELTVQFWLTGTVPDAEVETWKVALTPDQRGQHPTVHFEGQIIPRKGPPRIVAWDTMALRGQAGQLAGLAAIGRDITHQRSLEMDLRQAQKLESTGRLAAGIAHDFNNLLSVILGHTSLLLKRAEETDPAHQSLSAIESSTMMCAKLTEQLLAFGRRQHLRPEPLGMNALIVHEEGIIRSLMGPGVELVFNLESALGLVYVDPTQIRRVFANLVTNARDAMPQGGRLEIATSTQVVDAEDPAYPGVKPGAYVGLTVTDTGVGLRDDVKAHMFEPFFTTKAPGKGTGLGLATVYGIITQSGGHVLVHSEPGRGTTIAILLPVASAPA
jgi:two-component system, cell cycle sensor histidine kinase and response regulator CckA